MDVKRYLAMPYTTILQRDEDGDVVARIEELPGCVAHGKDTAEALVRLEEVQRAWIEESLALGQAVPEPDVAEELPSGKWLQRVPRSLHFKLSRRAKKEGVSLNQFVATVLAESLGSREVTKDVPVSELVPSHELDWSWKSAHSDLGSSPSWRFDFRRAPGSDDRVGEFLVILTNRLSSASRRRPEKSPLSFEVPGGEEHERVH